VVFKDSAQDSQSEN